MANVRERLIFDNFHELEIGTILRATARSSKRVLAFVILSVGPSVCLSVRQGRSDGGISVYPQNQSTLNFFMWLFCLLAMTS